MLSSIPSSVSPIPSTPESVERNSSEKRAEENLLSLNMSSFHSDGRALITRRLESSDESNSFKMLYAVPHLEDAHDVPKTSTHPFISAMYAFTLPFRIVGKLCAASIRLLNPFSSRHVWSGERHPQGHSPLKYRSLIHADTIASMLSLSYMPRDYVPRLGASAGVPNIAKPIEQEKPLISDAPAAAYFDKIVADLPKSGLTFEIVNKRYPGLIDTHKFAHSPLVDLDGELPYDFVRRVVISQPKHFLTRKEVEAKFPHIPESGDFQLAVNRGEKLFSPLFLIYCERERYNFPAAALVSQTERIFAETLDSNTFTSEMRRHPVFGPFIDNLLEGAAQNVTNNAHQESTTAAIELFKQDIFKRSKKYVIDHGTAPELIRQLDTSLDEIDKKNPAK